jgi:hypothetical protein
MPKEKTRSLPIRRSGSPAARCIPFLVFASLLASLVFASQEKSASRELID